LGVKEITAGGLHTCALKTDGSVVCWGDNFYGQIGDNTTTQRNTPTQVSGLVGGDPYYSSGTFTSVPRYVLLCFPSFLLFGQWLSLASGTYRRLYIAASLGLFILFLMLFVRGYWVA